MLHLRVYSPSDVTQAVLGVLREDPAVSNLVLLPGAGLQPVGDVFLVDVAREAGNDVIDKLVRLGVHQEGAIHVEEVQTWVSRRAYDAERLAPGSSADSVVWAEVVQRAYDDSELNWTYLTLMVLATLLAGIAIVLDSQVLVIGAMVLGPEFGAVAALGVALVRRRSRLLTLASRTLVLGFLAAIAVTTAAAGVGRAIGWIDETDVTRPRPGTAFIYTPDKWSFLVALIAAAAGVLSLTSAKLGGLSGVFISVTTIPAAGNIALGIAFGLGDEVWGSSLQLVVNLTGMALAGWAMLALQRSVWDRVSLARAKDFPSRREGGT